MHFIALIYDEIALLLDGALGWLHPQDMTAQQQSKQSDSPASSGGVTQRANPGDEACEAPSGAMALTWIPRLRPSMARVLVSPSSAAFIDA